MDEGEGGHVGVTRLWLSNWHHIQLWRPIMQPAANGIMKSTRPIPT